ncbi:MAG: hypothetical protein JW932_19235 [Deltaproteobacteria bacterium]|nr:hypothetical protein [Deltaproteobacteria bacterium]
MLNVHLQEDQGIHAYVEAIEPLIKDLAENHIYLAIENTPLAGPDAMNALFGEILRLDDKDTAYVGMCFDMGHANLYPATRNDYLGYMTRLEPDVPNFGALCLDSGP